MELASRERPVDEMIKKSLRSIVLFLVDIFGSKIRDYASGELLGKAFVFAWRGQIHIIGLKTAVVLRFQPQQRLTYWKQEIGFTVRPRPDFPGETRSNRLDSARMRPPSSSERAS